MTYANIAVTLALVFAMTGGAVAAGHYLITSTKQISPKVLKALRGKAGASGAQGAQGVQGPAGPAGPAGAKGENGKNGSNGGEGKEGKAGESVTSAKLEEGEGGCVDGGTKFTVGGKETTACNGTTGFTATLPAGATETGNWAFSKSAQAQPAEGVAVSSISFSIPLSIESFLIVAQHTLYNEPGPNNECPGSAAEPKAAPGSFCVYQSTLSGSVFHSFVTLNEGGAVLYFTVKNQSEVTEGYGFGTWAVTAG